MKSSLRILCVCSGSLGSFDAALIILLEGYVSNVFDGISISIDERAALIVYFPDAKLKLPSGPARYPDSGLVARQLSSTVILFEQPCQIGCSIEVQHIVFKYYRYFARILGGHSIETVQFRFCAHIVELASFYTFQLCFAPVVFIYELTEGVRHASVESICYVHESDFIPFVLGLDDLEVHVRNSAFQGFCFKNPSVIEASVPDKTAPVLRYIWTAPVISPEP